MVPWSVALTSERSNFSSAVLILINLSSSSSKTSRVNRLLAVILLTAMIYLCINPFLRVAAISLYIS